MGIKWLNKALNYDHLFVSIYDKSICFNKNVCDLINKTVKVMLGLDYDNKVLYIKCFTKDLILEREINSETLYNIIFRNSYASINNATFIKEIKKMIAISKIEKPLKCQVKWNNKEQLLIIDLKLVEEYI